MRGSGTQEMGRDSFKSPVIDVRVWLLLISLSFFLPNDYAHRDQRRWGGLGLSG